MLKIIIADDEPWVAYHLSHLVDYETLGFEVTAVVHDGLQALQRCREEQADVLISDIRMPGMSGLELLERVKKQDNPPEVILVSGYAEFAYAQQAVRHGAFDYLIKQVSAAQMEEVLRRMRAHLHMRAQSVLPGDDSVIFRLLDADSGFTLAQWLRLENRSDSSPAWRLITFAAGSKAESEIRRAELLTVRSGSEKITCLVPEDESGPRLPPSAQHTACGISARCSVSDSFIRQYRQSDIAFCTARFRALSQPLCYDAFGDMEHVSALLSEIQFAASRADLSLTLSLLYALERQCAELSVSQLAQLFNRLNECIAGSGSGGLDDDELDYRKLTQEYASLHELFEAIRGLILIKAPPTPQSFEQVLQFIDSRFCQELRISDVAEHFHFSPSYFSSYFHRQAGIKFTKYVAEKRITLAKRLLSETDFSLQEIARQCGYGDYYQFNKLFKKQTDLTPGQWRKQSIPR